MKHRRIWLLVASAVAVGALLAWAAGGTIKIQRVELDQPVEHSCTRLDLVFLDDQGKAMPTKIDDEFVRTLMIQENNETLNPNEIFVDRQSADTPAAAPSVTAPTPGTTAAPTPTPAPAPAAAAPAASDRLGYTVLMVVDTSASMSKMSRPDDPSHLSKIEAAKQAMRDFVAKKGPQDRIGILPFARTMPAPEAVVFQTDNAAILAQIDRLQAGSREWGAYTCLYKAVSVGLTAMAQQGGPREIIVLTDGSDSSHTYPDVPPENRLKLDDIKPAIANAAGTIKIETVGFGDPRATGLERLNELPLKDIAALSGGEYRYADIAAKVSTAYQDFQAVLRSEIHLYFRTKLTPTELRRNVQYRVSVKSFSDQHVHSFVDLMGNVRTAKQSFDDQCLKIFRQPAAPQPPPPAKKQAATVTIIFLMSLTLLGIMFSLPFLFGAEAIAASRTAETKVSRALLPSERGQSGPRSPYGYRPGGQGPTRGAAFPQPERTKAAPHAATFGGAGERTVVQPAPSPAEASAAGGYPYFYVFDARGIPLELAIHETYYPYPLAQVFANVVQDYLAAGIACNLAGHPRAMSVGGRPVALEASLQQLRLTGGARIDVQMG
jgi:Mg-chelatase subunit ChlD